MIATTPSASNAAVPESTPPRPSELPDPAGRWSTRLSRAAGFVVLLWVLWFVAQLVALRRNPLWFDRLHELSHNAGMRAAACAVLAALLWHSLTGIRLLVFETIGEPTKRTQTWGDLLVLFAWFALAIPAMTVIMWPALERFT